MKKNQIKYIFSMVLIMALMLPYLLAAFYGNPSGDDFDYAKVVLEQNTGNAFFNVLKATRFHFLTWHGTYSASFLSCAGIYLFHNKGTFLIHVEFFVSIVLLFFAFYYLCRAFFSRIAIKKEEYVPILVTAILTFTVLYDYEVGEVFYWHAGVSAYTIPISFGLLSIGIAISRNKRPVNYVSAGIFALISVGGALDISAFVCCFFLIYVTYLYIHKMKWLDIFWLFLCSLIGTLVNVSAPGNYAKHSAVSSDYPIFQSIAYSIVGVFRRNVELIFGISMPLIFVMVIIVFNYIDESKHVFVNPFILAVVFGVSEVIIDFPVYLGYSSNYMPTRCDFVSRIAMVLLLYIWIINTIGWGLGNRKICRLLFNKQTYALVVFAILSSVIPFVQKDVNENYYPFIIYSDLLSGRLEKYETDNNIIISALENASGEDVVVEIYGHVDLDYMHSLRLSEDPTYWVNLETITYYRNAKSISVIYK